LLKRRSQKNDGSSSLLNGFPSEYLTKEEEMRIGLLHSNDAERWKLVTHNARLCYSEALKCCRESLDMDECFSEALNLAGAASKRYDSRRGTKFITYCKQYVCTGLMNWKMRRLKAVRINNYFTTKRHEGNAVDAIIPPTLVDKNVFINECQDLHLCNKEIKYKVLKEIDRLIQDGKLKEIIYMYYGLQTGKSMTAKEIGEKLGILPHTITNDIRKARQVLKDSKILKALLLSCDDYQGIYSGFARKTASEDSIVKRKFDFYSVYDFVYDN